MTSVDFVSDGDGGHDTQSVNTITVSRDLTERLGTYVEFVAVVGTAPGFDWQGRSISVSPMPSPTTYSSISAATSALPDPRPTISRSSAFPSVSKMQRPMKLRLPLLIVAALLLSVHSSWAAKKRVVTTFTIIQDMAQNVAGDAAIVESITKPGAEIHGYEPTPQDIVKAQQADLVLWNGLNLERWFERFFGNLRKVPSAVLTEGIEPIGIEEGPYTGKPNPHAWMSPRMR